MPNLLSYRRWQFSIREMLLFTTVVAAVLCFAVKLPLVFHIALGVIAGCSFLAAIMWTANFATSERRPWLALLSWAAFGLFFLLLASFAAMEAIESSALRGDLDMGAVYFATLMGACCAVCGYRAVRALLIASGSQSAGNRSDSERSL